jgi:ornithine decarboxylase
MARVARARTQAPPVARDQNVVQGFDLAHVERELARGYDGPFLVLDAALIRAKLRRFEAAMPRVRAHFAVKSNPAPPVLEVLHRAGGRFEIASRAELDALLALSVPAREIFYSNPVKGRAHLAHAVECGVTWYAIDSVEELRKITALLPEAKLYLRLYTSNEGSAYKLSGKFGAHEPEAGQIIAEAARVGADLAGISFNVGSQCSNVENWRAGLAAARSAFEQMQGLGLAPRLVNIGGGFPVDMGYPVPSIEEIGAVVNESLATFPDDVHAIAEPGRYLVGDTGWFICQVIGTATRKGQRWLFLDAGRYGGLYELKDIFDLAIRTERRGALVPWTIAGPTCDAQDVCQHGRPLPEDLREGDFLYVQSIGAYSNAGASDFNGFAPPRVVVV